MLKKEKELKSSKEDELKSSKEEVKEFQRR